MSTGNFQNRSRPCVLLLAAGAATRFGADKRRCQLESGSRLLEQTLAAFLDRDLAVYIALSASPRDDAFADELALKGFSVVRCARAEEGMGATISEGIGFCKDFPATFVALADMPLVSAVTLKHLEEAGGAERIVYPVYQGRRGHPVLFAQSFYSQLETLGGAQGAAVVLAANAECCRQVLTDDPGVVMDVDTPAQLAEVEAVLRLRP